ncbi:MAG: amidase [Acidimicrobiales bacterium]
MDGTDLCFAGASEQARLVRACEVSTRELTAATLSRIEAVDPQLNSYRVVLGDQAMAAAAEADELTARGETAPLLGVPVAIKDNVDVAGVSTSHGVDAGDSPAAADAPVVAALRAAGAVIVGKTTCSELAVWPFTETAAWGDTRNPWNTDFSPGGSSGGSGAAVAAGLCGLALGSDGLGSIRVPAGFTGVFGIKPQRGRVWHDPAGWNGLSVNGPLCRRVVDAALFLDATASDLPPGGFAGALDRGARPLRIAVSWKSPALYPLAARLGTQQRDAVNVMVGVLRDLGHTVVEREVDYPFTLSSTYLFRYLAGVAEESQAYPDVLSTRTRHMAMMGRWIPGPLLRWALRAETGLASRVNTVFDDFDVVLTPGSVEAPLRVGELAGRGAVRTLYASGRKIPNFAPWNAIGQPAISVPAGFDDAGLPLSVQFAGRPHDEATLLALAAQIEAVRPWADDRPPLGTGD